MPQDYSEEKKPNIKMLLPEGWRKFFVSSCSKEAMSKKGNPQYIATLLDEATQYEDTVYLVNVKGKRWMLKSLCEACSVPKSELGFLFEPPEPPPVVKKFVMGLVIHEPNEYINREGVTIKAMQHKIVEFRAIDKIPETPDDIQFEE